VNKVKLPIGQSSHSFCALGPVEVLFSTEGLESLSTVSSFLGLLERGRTTDVTGTDHLTLKILSLWKVETKCQPPPLYYTYFSGWPKLGRPSPLKTVSNLHQRTPHTYKVDFFSFTKHPQIQSFITAFPLLPESTPSSGSSHWGHLANKALKAVSRRSTTERWCSEQAAWSQG
jgi:hypothetical protein